MNAVTLLDPQTASQFAARIAARWQQSLDAIFEVGQLLVRAKEALPHGDFEAMIATDLPFGSRHARRLMDVARNEQLANRTHMSVLPPHVSTLYELSKLAPATFEAKIADGTIRPDMEAKDIAPTVSQANRKARLDEMAHLSANPLALPQGPFAAGIADPPWEDPDAPIGHTDRHYRQHYPTMTPAEIAAFVDCHGRPIKQIFGPVAFLALWITRHHLAIGSHIEVLKPWGFEPKTVVTWDKELIGLGNGYVRDRSEHVVYAVRGKPPVPEPALRPDSIFAIRRTPKHSQKPDWQHQRIEEWFPEVTTRVELFSRSDRPGWVAWGHPAEQLPPHDPVTGEIREDTAA